MISRFAPARNGLRPSAAFLALTTAALSVAPASASQGGDPCGPWGADAVVPSDFGIAPLDVVALEDGTAWAAGFTFGFSSKQPCFWRFDGAAWQFVWGPPAGGIANGGGEMRALGVEPSGRLWAAGRDSVTVTVPSDPGSYFDAPTPLVTQWTGVEWKKQWTPLVAESLAGAEVYDLAVVGNDDVWFVGAKSDPLGPWLDPLPCDTGFAMHWNGAQFTQWDTPCVTPAGGSDHRLVAVAASSSTDVWAVGDGEVAPGVTRSYIVHFDGIAWALSPHPAPGTEDTLTAVVALASDDVWAVGRSTDAQGTQGYAVHWDGVSWSLVSLPGIVHDLIAFGPNSIYGVGEGVFRWNGASWSAAAATPGELFGVDASSVCRMVAVGQGPAFVPGTGAPQFGRTQPTPSGSTAVAGCGSAILQGSLVAVAPPTLGGILSIAMDDPSAQGGLVPGVSVPLWLLSAAPSPLAPCGVPIPGLGVGGTAGELLGDVGALLTTLPLGGVWAGPGVPNTLAVGLPNIPSLVGQVLHSQGLWLFASPQHSLLLTNGLSLQLGY